MSSATQHAMPPEFGRKWGTEYLNTRFPLPTLLCAGYIHVSHTQQGMCKSTLRFALLRKETKILNISFPEVGIESTNLTIPQICKSVQRFWRYEVIKNITYIQDTREKHNPSLVVGN